MILRFTKMHGCGNDYIYINCFFQKIENIKEIAVQLSDRHYGIGGDGVILICHSDIADAKMRIFNSDGSEGEMCGNGIRCVAKYLYDKRIISENKISIETLSGIKFLEIFTNAKGEAENIKVDMGKPIFEPKLIPVNADSNKIFIKIDGESYKAICLSMGNPHCVVFCNNLKDIDLKKVGPCFEKHDLFPKGINTEFVEISNTCTNKLKMRVWERGSGETLACGTGACAAVVAAVESKYFEQGHDVEVQLIGGTLSICYNKQGRVYMTGEAKKVFDGRIEI